MTKESCFVILKHDFENGEIYMQNNHGKVLKYKEAEVLHDKDRSVKNQKFLYRGTY